MDGVSLTVLEDDGSPSISGVSELRFVNAAVTDNGAGSVTVTPTGGGSPLTVKESDGSPSVSDVTEVQFDGATVTDLTGGVVKVTVSGGTGSLTVKESDGSPSVASVTELQIEGATVTEVSAGVAKVTVTGGGGTAPVLATDVFVATEGQTVFALTYAPLTGGIIYVSRDGVVADASAWALAGSDVTFGSGLDAGTDVQITYWRTAPTGTTPSGEGFTATEGQTEFTLAHSATASLVIAVNGVVQTSTAWSLVGGTTLTFVTGLASGETVWISYLY